MSESDWNLKNRLEVHELKKKSAEQSWINKSPIAERIGQGAITVYALMATFIMFWGFGIIIVSYYFR